MPPRQQRLTTQRRLALCWFCGNTLAVADGRLCTTEYLKPLCRQGSLVLRRCLWTLAVAVAAVLVVLVVFLLAALLAVAVVAVAVAVVAVVALAALFRWWLWRRRWARRRRLSMSRGPPLSMSRGPPLSMS